MIKDISPKTAGIRAAGTELYVPPLDVPIGQLIGGSQMFSNSSKSGSGNQVFGQDLNGIWLGAADFADAPFSVSLKGDILIRNGANASFFDAKVLGFSDGSGNWSIIIGDPTALPIL